MEPKRAPRRRLRGVKAGAAADTRESRVQQVDEINKGLSKMLGKLDKIGARKSEGKKAGQLEESKMAGEVDASRKRKLVANPINSELTPIQEKEAPKYTPVRTHKGDILGEDELCHVPVLDEKYVSILQTLKATGQQLRDN